MPMMTSKIPEVSGFIKNTNLRSWERSIIFSSNKDNHWLYVKGFGWEVQPHLTTSTSYDEKLKTSGFSYTHFA